MRHGRSGVHSYTKLHNHLDLEKVHKQVLIKTNFMEKYPSPTWVSQKHKFGIIEADKAMLAMPTPESALNSGVFESPMIQTLEHNSAGQSLALTTPSSSQSQEHANGAQVASVEGLSNSLITCPFPEVIRTLISDGAEADLANESTQAWIGADVSGAAGTFRTPAFINAHPIPAPQHYPPVVIQPFSSSSVTSTSHDSDDPSHLVMRNLFHFPLPNEMMTPSLKALLAFWQAGKTALANEMQVHDSVCAQMFNSSLSV
ncbi:hypothetical protein PAXRUDRAFT_20189 [Paxillus rubicundulus Ve08.2h10]|uniref:Uncharacterized protein n=1 Tax=Paxillus rubicundulus Ve08.2h10 TaxID=930991 RepID=A0A0D0CFC2_9AGAM|nr:hypothetical protein PAXRUDRAFT_20189 [Paxillus rubicundulus Ve08.2h10]